MVLIDKETFKADYKRKLISMYQKSVDEARPLTQYMALGSLIRDYLAEDWHNTESARSRSEEKQVFYFSLEFLIGRLLDSILVNLGIRDVVSEGLSELGVRYPCLEDIEPDAGLGNGGLGRLAACFIDSMASLGIPGVGVGIRYRYGLFRQQIQNGYQIETPDDWLKIPNVWEIRRDSEACIIKFGGKCEMNWGGDGRLYVNLVDYDPVLAVPYDMPVAGFRNGVVNTLRLWSAETEGPGFDFTTFSKGDYEKAVANTTIAHSISNVLYPDDSTPRGKMLRLKQEYFFTSAGIQSIVRKFKKEGKDLHRFHEYAAIHINDTHPALAVPELMRILIDEEGFSWDEAWNITVNTIGYTNHTILAEALEKWPVEMMKTLLPRIYMIIEEINKRFTESLSETYSSNWDKISGMSIISEGVIRMAYLAIVGSHSVNGVAALHTEILKTQELKDFHEFYPGKFNNKTNGITHRRWLIEANPDLTAVINSTIGEGWQKNPLELRKLMPYTGDSSFVEKIAEAKMSNKRKLAEFVRNSYSIELDCNSIFDIQVKRLHMYKRQLLNIMGIMNLYNELCDNPDADIYPHTFIFAAKAFPGYGLAKNTIKLICTVADRINNDPRIKGRIKVVFVPNYGVTLAQKLIPAGDISEQISTASKEASGTGNMKFMMNGSVTLATLDGANVEIRNEVGDDNIFLFGMHADEVIALQKNRNYNSREYAFRDPRIARIIHQMEEGYFGLARPGEFTPVIDHLIRDNDPYFIIKDFDSYVAARRKAEMIFRDRERFNRMAAVNIAASGVFSSDNTIMKYADEIWNVHPEK